VRLEPKGAAERSDLRLTAPFSFCGEAFIINSMFNLIEELVAIARVFTEEGIDYAVCGGMAMAIHGYTRATEDIDILVDAEDLPRIRRAVKRVGFDTMGTSPDFRFKNGGRVVRLLKTKPPEDYLILDLMLASGPYEAPWKSRIDQPSQWGPIRVVSQEALKAMKLEAGRAKDRFDIEMMENPDEAH
jgi:hypothetical protein